MLWFTENTVPARRLRAIAAVLLLMAGSPAAVQAGEGAGLLSPGDAVVTGFSGTLPPPDGLPDGADPLDYTFIDPEGAALQVQRFLPAGPPAGQLIDAPALVTAPARDVGQVFAVTLDDAQAPNIYLGATSSFGIHIVAPGDDGTPRHVKQGMPGAQFMQGQWGTDKGGAPGSIYRMDGTTGEITLFSSIGSNAGPGLGDVVFGRAIAVELARQGANVALADIRPPEETSAIITRAKVQRFTAYIGEKPFTGTTRTKPEQLSLFEALDVSKPT